MRRFFLCAPFALALGWAVACSSTTTEPLADAGTTIDATATDRDGGSDAALPGDGGNDAAQTDASCTTGTPASTKGETCIGFGKGTPCDQACGEYGYVCFNGGPPNIASCREMRVSATLGNTYCCPTLSCVREPDQDTKCTNAARPKRYQCPTAADGGALTLPLTACEEDVAGRMPGSNFYCCAN
jgi:hypothetical protein